ncbi:hypothetical protein L0F63_004621 [Massospora cicadina]|nr:hypothetical protein L0F63_004621 [Massospora cicadina]
MVYLEGVGIFLEPIPNLIVVNPRSTINFDKKGDVGLINRNANLLDSRQGLGLNSLGTSALPLNEDCVEPELKPLKELECPILVVQSDEGDLYLSLSGKYHVNTIPHLAIYQGLPRPLNLSISRKGNWDVEIALIREGVARTTRTLNLEAYLPPKGLRLPAIFQQVLYELGPFGTGLERLGQNLQAHARAYQTHAKSLATKGSPTATLRRLLVSGMVGPDICAFLAAPELKKYEAWVETYAKGAQKLKLEVRNSVLSPLEKVISQLSMLGTNFEACEERRGLRLACRCACGLSIRARQLCNLLELDRKQFTSLIRSIMDIASGLEGGEPALRIPPPDILALNFLDRANDAGPTLDLQRFFIASEGAREHLQPDLERASSLVEDLGLFDVQTFELQSGPIHGKDATLPQLYNSF